MNSAAKCRKNGWTAGTVLEGDEGYGADRILITAIGERLLLARLISIRGKPVDHEETLWTLEFRKWRKAKGNRHERV